MRVLIDMHARDSPTSRASYGSIMRVMHGRLPLSFASRDTNTKK